MDRVEAEISARDNNISSTINSEINRVESEISSYTHLACEGTVDVTRSPKDFNRSENNQRRRRVRVPSSSLRELHYTETTDDKNFQLHEYGARAKGKIDYITDEELAKPIVEIMNRFHPKIRVARKLTELKSVSYQKFVILNPMGWNFNDILELFAHMFWKKNYWRDTNSKVQLLFSKEFDGLVSQKGEGVSFYRTSLMSPDKINYCYIKNKLVDAPENNYGMPELNSGDLMSITVRKVNIPRGRGRNNENNSKNKISPPFETYCGQACLVIHLQKTLGVNTYHNWLNKNRTTVPWMDAAIELGKLINHESPEMVLHDFDKFITIHPEHSVCVFDENRDIIYQSPMAKHVCYLWLKDGHYQYITKILSFMGYDKTKKNYKFCEYCVKLYTPQKGIKGHKCASNDKCSNYQCNYHFENYEDKINHRKDPCESKCKYCNCKLWFKSCKEAHEIICGRDVWFCDDCNKKVDISRMQDHKCGEYHCRNCNIMVEPDAEGNTTHRCYLQPLKKSKAGKINQYAFDIECVYDPETCRHEFSMLVLKSIDDNEELIFTDVAKFHDFVNTTSNKKQITHLWAHNAKGYDSFMLFHIFKEEFNITPNKLIRQGQKIMMMRYGTVSFLDSMNHIAGSLNNLIPTFGLDISGKDYFPYRWYTTNNIKYIGLIPDKKYFNCARCSECCSYDKCSSDKIELRLKKKLYLVSGGTGVLDVEMMTDEMKEKSSNISDDIKYNVRNGETCKCKHFHEWHDDWRKNKYTYDIHEECLEYCRNDVDILKEALYAYRMMAKEITGVDPLKKITISSYAYEYYRLAHLQPKSIALLNRGEYDFARATLQGGRTNAIGFYYKGPMRYIDVVSLYPSVQLNGVFPAGHPLVNKEPKLKDTLTSILEGKIGFAKVDIITPKNLYHPLLLVKKGGKLVESLLDEDFKEVSYTYCELKKALELKYIITKVYETHEYRGCKEMFKSYVKKLFEMKNKFSIEGNVGKKNIVKMLLNSLWGKTGQKDICKKDEFLTMKQFFELLSKEEKYNVLDFEEMSTDNIFVQYTPIAGDDDEKLNLNNSNPAVASYTTSQARLVLYDAMEILGDRVLYHDTDSLIYRYLEDDLPQPLIAESTEIGKWELEKEIIEYVSIGAKSYAYRYLSVDGTVNEVVKSKGFNSEWITFDHYKEMVDGEFVPNKFGTYKINTRIIAQKYSNQQDPPEVIRKKELKFLDDFHMKRTKNGVTNIGLIKKLSYVYDKRVIDKTNITKSYPHGYVSPTLM